MPSIRPIRAPALDHDRTIDRLVVPLADPDASDRAVVLASSLAHAWNVPMQIVHVDVAASSYDPDLRALQQAVSARHRALHVDAVAVSGADPAGAIANHVEPADLVVMATNHIDAWRIKGSVATAVLDRIGVPVLLIGPQVTLERLRSRGIDGDVIVGVDGSVAAEAGLPPAVALARSIGRALWLVRVEPEPSTADRATGPEAGRYLQALVERCDDGVTTHTAVVENNDPVGALVGAATERDAGCVVAARHDRADVRHRSMASVAAGLAAKAPSPVLVVTAPRIGTSDGE